MQFFYYNLNSNKTTYLINYIFWFGNSVKFNKSDYCICYIGLHISNHCIRHLQRPDSYASNRFIVIMLYSESNAVVEYGVFAY